jgi:hypothetical protein
MNPSERESDEPLILSHEEMTRNAEALFADLAADEELRARFVNNPSGIVAERIAGRELGPQEESASNRIVFSLLSNEKFVEWMAEYGEKNELGANLDREKYARDLATAIVELGDKELLASILHGEVVGQNIRGVGPLASQFIVNNAAGQTFVVPVAQPSTSNQSAASTQNFHTSSGTIGVFGEGEFDVGFVRSVVDQLVNEAQTLRARGELADLETPIR